MRWVALMPHSKKVPEIRLYEKIIRSCSVWSLKGCSTSFCDFLLRWWSWRTSFLTARASSWCSTSCCLTSLRSSGIPSALWPLRRSKVTWWCCWRAWLSCITTMSCTGWAQLTVIIINESSDCFLSESCVCNKQHLNIQGYLNTVGYS